MEEYSTITPNILLYLCFGNLVVGYVPITIFINDNNYHYIQSMTNHLECESDTPLQPSVGCLLASLI